MFPSHDVWKVFRSEGTIRFDGSVWFRGSASFAASCAGEASRESGEGVLSSVPS